MGLATIRRFNLALCAAFLATLAVCTGTAMAGNVTYTVDPASGRVTRATYPDGSYIVYGYDANGNRTSAVVTLAQDTTPPSAPGTPAFSAITATSATATWTAATDNIAVSSYEWSRNGGSTWNSVGASLSASITGLTGSTSYTVLVRAKDAAGNAGPTSSGSFSTSDVTPPSAPGAPAFSSITATSATATWTAATDNVGVTSYEWSRNAGSTWTSVGNTLSTSITGLTGSTSYTVLVRAKDAAGNPGATSQAVLTTSDVTPPSVPGAPAFSAITATSATATWTAASDNVGVTSYEWSRNGGSSWTSVGLTLSASISGLTGSTNYTVLVRAKDAAGNPGATSSNSFTTLPPNDAIAPGVPGTPSFNTITATSANATWAAASDNVGVTGYEYSLNGGTWTATGSASPGVNLIGLTSGVTYTFAVRAKDAANNTGPSSSNSFATLDNVPPTAPGTPTFSSITSSSATASWTAASDNVGVTGYEYSLNGGAWTSNGSSISVGLTGLSQATSYTLQVRAKDAANNPGPASSNTFSTPDVSAPTVPGAPTFSSITGSSATASWAASTDNVGVVEYQYAVNSGGWTSNGASLSVGLTGLSNATSYTVYVRARDAANNWSTYTSNSFTTLDTAAPSVPGAPAFSSITGSSATASWTASTDNVGVVEYQYAVNSGGWTSNGASLSVGLTGLGNASTYTVYVRARDAADNWSAYTSNSFTTLDTQAPTVPGAPTFSSITGSSATASWAASTDNVGVAEYQYAVNSGGWISNGSSTSVGLTGLSNASTYTVYVRARDAANNWSAYTSNSFATPDTVAPGAPGTPTFSSLTGSSASASWGAASDNVGVTGYQWRLNSGSWNAVGGPPASLTGLSANTTYTFEVQARDAAGNWGPSSSASFTTPVLIQLSSYVVWSTGGSQPHTSTSYYKLTPSGDVMVSPAAWGGADRDVGDWIVPKSGMANYQARMASGNCFGPAAGTWIAMSNTPTWLYTVGGNSPVSGRCDMIVEISAIANPSVILATAPITINTSF